MPAEDVIRLFKEYLGPGTLALGILCLLLVLFATLFAKDLRISIFIFLLVLIFTDSANLFVRILCYVFRWLILAMITIRLFLGRVRPKLALVQVLFVLWIVAAMFSVIQAPSTFRGVVFGVVYLLCFFVFFILVLSEIETEEHLQRWFKMFTVLGWTFALLAFGLFILNPREYRYAGRLALTFGNPQTLGRALVFAGAIFFWNGLRRTGNLLRQSVYYIAALVCAFLIFLSGSRGAIGGFAIILVFFALHYRRKMALLVIPLLVISASYVVPQILAYAPERFATHVAGLETAHRPMLRELGVQRFKERPVRGWGLGSVSDTRADVCPRFTGFHNAYLDYLVEFGLPGFLIVMTVLLYTFLRVWRLALFGARTEYIRDAAWFVGAYLGSLFVWTYFDGSIANPASVHFYWLFILIVFTECLVRINKQIEYDFADEYSHEIRQVYDEAAPCAGGATNTQDLDWAFEE